MKERRIMIELDDWCGNNLKISLDGWNLHLENAAAMRAFSQCGDICIDQKCLKDAIVLQFLLCFLIEGSEIGYKYSASQSLSC